MKFHDSANLSSCTIFNSDNRDFRCRHSNKEQYRQWRIDDLRALGKVSCLIDNWLAARTDTDRSTIECGCIRAGAE